VGRFFPIRKPKHRGHGVTYLAASCLAVTLAIAGCDSSSRPAPGAGHGGTVGGTGAVGASGTAPAAKTPICGQPILNSPYRYNSYQGSSLTTFASGEHGLPTYGSAGSDYPDATAGYIVPPGDNGSISGTINNDHVLVYFEPGEHLNGPGLAPGSYSAYIGGYSPQSGEATIDNGGQPGTTFESNGSHVTIEYLTVKNFNGNGNNDSFGGSIVDEYGGYDWTVDYDTVGPNGNDLGNPNTGYGIGVGSDSRYEYDCVIKNGEGGFNNGTATATLKDPAPWGGPSNYTIAHDEIADNAIATCQTSWGCPNGTWGDVDGVAAGIKVFWSLNGTIDHNYIHDNYGSGVWPDTNNSGIDISYNYISNNFAEAILYEASFNANITHNTITGNGWNPEGTSEWAGYPNGYQTTNGGGPSFVDGAIAINSSGGSTNIQSGSSRYLGQLNVTGNYLVNNFGGIAAFQDRNRFCGEGADGGEDTCTLNGAYSGGNYTGSPYYVQPTSYTDKPALANGSTSLTAIGGFQSNYSDGHTKPGSGWTVRAYQADTGDVVPGIFPAGETIASCTSNSSCTLTQPALADVSDGNKGSTPIEIETGPPGGCGMYNLIGASAGASSGSPSNAYFDNCNWWIQDLTVSRNVFVMNANPTKTWKAGSVTNCTAADGCGYMVLYAGAGACTTGCFWSPYANNVVADYITSPGARNAWSDNSYSWTGPGGWTFEAGVTSNVLSQSAWRGSPYQQDAGSTFSG
jgi:Right handed beta helix region